MGQMNNWGYNVSGGGSSSPLTFPDSGIVNALAIMPGAINILDGYVFTVTGIVASNTGATTISINNGSPINIVGMNNLSLQGGELTASFDAEFLLNSAGTATLLGTSNGSLPIKGGTQTNQAINYGQLQGAITTILAETLQTNNNLSEIEARGATAQNAAKDNLAIPSPSTFLQVANLLSEIEALGPTAQETAQTNLGVSTAGFLQVANLLSEIAALGAPDQATALANLGGQKSGLSLLIANYLSEISAAGSVAQTSARNNIGAQQAGVSLLTANNLSEIEAAGPLAQSAAQTNLGISFSGYLKTSNNLSEIAAEGSAAQSTARTNLGIDTASFLQTANYLSEISAAGSVAQTSARNNIGAQQAGVSLLTANNLSEIEAAGPLAQSAAQTNLGISFSGYLKTSNNLSEIAAEGSAAQATARTNLGINTSNFLQTGNNLSEIEAEGTTAQAAARENIGAQVAGTSLQTANALGEIATAGTQSTARTNIGAQQAGVSLLTANNLSEIATAGTAAQSTARTNIGAQVSGTSLQTANLLSEIAALGSTAQATAQSNLGISGGGSGGSGRLLGVALITTSQTYTMPSGTNTIIAEIVGGGSGSVGVAATSSSDYGICREGFPGTYMMVEIPVSQLSTHATGTVIVGIGAAGAAGTASNSGAGGNTTIDTTVAVAAGGPSQTYNVGIVSSNSVGSTTTFFATFVQGSFIWTGTVVSPTTIIKLLDGTSYDNIAPITGFINGFSTVLATGAPFNGASGGKLVTNGTSFFNSNTDVNYGGAGQSMVLAASKPATEGFPGIQGAVRLWMYS